MDTAGPFAEQIARDAYPPASRTPPRANLYRPTKYDLYRSFKWDVCSTPWDASETSTRRSRAHGDERLPEDSSAPRWTGLVWTKCHSHFSDFTYAYTRHRLMNAVESASVERAVHIFG